MDIPRDNWRNYTREDQDLKIKAESLLKKKTQKKQKKKQPTNLNQKRISTGG